MTCHVEERGATARHFAGSRPAGLGFAWIGLVIDMVKGKQSENASSTDVLYQQAQAAAAQRAAEARSRTITTVALVAGGVGILALAGGLTYFLGKK